MIVVKLLLKNAKITTRRFVIKRVTPPAIPLRSKPVKSEKSARQAGMPIPKDKPNRSATSESPLTEDAENKRGITAAMHPEENHTPKISIFLALFDRAAPSKLETITAAKKVPLTSTFSSIVMSVAT
jgi:hypothetical protein